MKRTPVAIAVDKNGNPTVVCDDGSAFFWGPDPEKVKKLADHQQMQFEMGRLTVGHKWLPFHQAVPGCGDPQPVTDAEVDEFLFGSSTGGIKGEGDASEWVFDRDAVRKGIEEFLARRGGSQ